MKVFVRLCLVIALTTAAACGGGGVGKSTSEDGSGGSNAPAASGGSNPDSGGKPGNSGGMAPPGGGTDTGGSGAGAGGMGTGSVTEGSGGTDTGPIARVLPQITSVAPSFILSSDRYSYSPQHTFESQVDWRIVAGPSGMRLEDDSRVEWDPSALDDSAHEKPHHVVLEGKLGDDVVQQVFDVEVATVKKRASHPFLADLLGQMSVSAPGSKIRGAGITMPVGALLSDTTVDINEMDKSPKFPNLKNAPSVVDFGPSGLSFKKPATVALPFNNAGKVNLAKLGAFTFNTKESRWESVPVVSIDIASGILYARASHFSIYAAAETAVDYQLTVESLDASTVCAGALAARGELNDGLASLEIASVNNLSDAMRALGASTVAELVADPGFTGTLRLVRVFKLTSDTGASERRKLVSSLVVDGDSATIVHTDSFGNIIAKLSFADRGSAFADIDAHLSGLATHVIFSADYNGNEFQIAGRLHVVYSEQDASELGATDGSLGAAAVEVPVGEFGMADPASSDFDVDCDRYRGGFDAFDNSLEPKIEAAPSEATTITAGAALTLTARVVDFNAAPTSVKWGIVAGDASAELTAVTGDTSSRSFTAEISGFYTVLVSVDVDGKALTTRFNIRVSPRPATNTPPTCFPTALVKVIEEGQSATVFAAVDDRQTATDSLEVEWGLAFDTGTEVQFVPSASITGTGSLVRFAPSSAGIYTIGCRAYDGSDWGEVGTTVVSTVAAQANQEPADLVASPLSNQAVVGATVKFKLSATDPNGDLLTYGFVHPFGSAATANAGTLTVNTATLAAGTYTLLGSVTDSIAPAQFVTMSLRVLAVPVSISAPDADDDGFPLGVDCNDNDAAINPDAIEICGNTVDENCDGKTVVTDCDGDGFAANDPTRPDCNDNNAAVNPDALEYCDGKDNNCDGKVDETYQVNNSCQSGLGECVSTGKLACGTDRVSTVCKAAPKASSAEKCDGKDNNCNGQQDEGQVCTAEKIGAWLSCSASDCSTLLDEGFELTSGGQIIMMSSLTRSGVYDASTTLCIDDQGTFSVVGEAVTVVIADEVTGAPTTIEARLTLVGADMARLSFVDPKDGTQNDELHKRVAGVHATGQCPDWCELDDDQDGTLNCEDPCPDDPNSACGSGPSCDADDDQDGIKNCQDPCPHDPSPTCDPCSLDDDQDGINNCQDKCPQNPDTTCDPCNFDDDQDGINNCEDKCPQNPDTTCDPCNFDDDQDGINNCQDPCPQNPDTTCDPCNFDDDQDGINNCQDPCPWDPDSTCVSPPKTCDQDGFDNNGDGVIDEPGEPCGGPQLCDTDSIDNNGDGVVDEPGEPCGPMYCDKDGIDNNGDGVVDEPGEPCGGPKVCDTDGVDNNGDGVVDEPGEPCPSYCDFDDDRDGVTNCIDLCPSDPYKSTDGGYCGCNLLDVDMDGDGTVDFCDPLSPPMYCDTDGIDNNGDGVVDEPGEPCGPMYCDRDYIDNNGDGVIDETGEPCGPMYCDKDGIDNNGDGVVDEPGEPCPSHCDFDDDGDGVTNCIDVCPSDPYKSTDGGYCGCNLLEVDTDGDGSVDSCDPLYPPLYCDADGIDNNGDGVVDEPGEPCGGPSSCDTDGIDNNGDGIVDELNEPCAAGICDTDGVDNDKDGVIDNPGEPCARAICDTDGIDNNGDGVTDEPGEPC